MTPASPARPPSDLIRVLIVDDVPEVRQELRQLLPLLGPIDVAGETAGGLEAVRQVEALRPAVVILDLAMPGIDGCEAARRIKALCPACRVVALTIHADEATRRAALAAGADAFIVKGAPIETLVDAVCAASAKCEGSA